MQVRCKGCGRDVEVDHLYNITVYIYSGGGGCV